MIHTYYNEERAFGFVTFLFKDPTSTVVNDIKTFETKSEKNQYLRKTRTDLLLCNLEYYVEFFSGDISVLSQLEKDSISRINDLLVWVSNNTDKYELIFKSANTCMKYIRTLFINYEGTDGAKAQMMFYLLKEFIDESNI